MGAFRLLIKNKFGDLNDSNSYRETMKTLSLFKLFELCSPYFKAAQA